MHRIVAQPGPTDGFLDVPGLNIGQAHDAIIKTGTTVVIPDQPVAMAADVRGGGPGTRETEALNPDCLVGKVHGLVLSGGSVFGLAAADRIVERLSQDGIGLPFGPHALPVIPSAILFDLRNDGDKSWDTPPYRRLADEAYDKLGHSLITGAAGAGYGAQAGANRGGLGSASFVTEDGLIVSALVAVNSFGSVENGDREPLGSAAFPKLGLVGGNTTIAAVATNLDLSKADCKRLAIMAHDGLARAIRPLHTPFDGDTVFALATGAKGFDGEEKPAILALAGALAADALEQAAKRAIVDD